MDRLARNQIVSSSNPACSYDTSNSVDGCEFEFQALGCAEERFGDFPLNLWGANVVIDYASSPLLPNNHFNSSNLSPATRKQAIEQGRKEVMEMMCHMPESIYELSLKDMVDHQQHEAEVQEKDVLKHKAIHLETESLIKEQMKKKRKVGSISRTGSMDTDRFLIKMFYPSCLSFKKNPIGEKSSKVTPRPCCEGFDEPVEKQGWIKRIFDVSRNHKNGNRIDNNNSSTSRLANRSSLPGCCPFFLSKKRGDFAI